MFSQKSESVKVIIRCRPFNQKEIIHRSNRCLEIQQIDRKNHQAIIKLISPKRHRRRIARLFRFDGIYDENHRTENIFQDFVQSLVRDATLHGYSGTVFAYGQTGSGNEFDFPASHIQFRYVGKSWTMTGCPCHSEHGLISNAIEDVFHLVHQQQSNSEEEQNFIIKCAYLESKIS
jgi:hypothetical protein